MTARGKLRETPSHAAEPRALAAEIRREVAGTTDRSVPSLRRVRQGLSERLVPLPGEVVLDVARRALEIGGEVPKWLVFELVHHHRGARDLLDASRLEEMGAGLAHWGEADPFATLLSGVAWREGRICDADLHRWARSESRWWRRAALVSTVALNCRARGGAGDAPRTLAVCDRLRDERDDMVVKALSWALRQLATRDSEAVSAWLEENRSRLARRVIREVTCKLATGLKAPRPRARPR